MRFFTIIGVIFLDIVLFDSIFPDLKNLSLEDKKMNFNFMGVAVKKGSHTIIKYVVDTGDDNEK